MLQGLAGLPASSCLTGHRFVWMSSASVETRYLSITIFVPCSRGIVLKDSLETYTFEASLKGEIGSISAIFWNAHNTPDIARK